MSAVTKVGDEIKWTIVVSNNGAFDDPNVSVQDTIPPGLAYKTYVAEKGTFNKTTGKWTVGLVPVGKSYQLIITYKVISMDYLTDESGVFGFYNVAVISGDYVDPNDDDNTVDNFIEVTTCAPSAGAIGDANACLCGDLSGDDTECTHWNTEYRIVPGSLVNLDPAFVLNTDGTYNASGLLLNPYIQATFQYKIWCVDGPDQLETAGPALVVIPAQFPSTFTDVVTDNANGTYTHKALDGTEVTWNAGWTTVEEDSGTGYLIFTYPNGDTVSINLGSITNPGQTVFPTVVTANIALTNVTLRNFTKINDATADINILLPDPATLGMGANRTHTYTFKRINAFGTGSITLTPDALKTIDGQASYEFAPNDYTANTIWHDGVNWFMS